MINYDQVRADITGDPILNGHFNNVKPSPKDEDTPQSDAAITALETHFNTDVAIFRDVPVSEFAAYLDLNGLTEKVRNASSTNPIAGTVARIAGLESSVSVLEISNPEKRIKIKAMLDTLVADNVWTQDEADGVFDLARAREPLYKSYGGVIGRGVVLLLKSGRV